MRSGDTVVVDTGPIIHLAEAGVLHLLSATDELLVPRVVIEELQAGGRPEALADLDFETRPVSVDSDGRPELDPGETAAIELCRQVDGVLLTDDLEARERANDVGIEVHGSLGVVLVAYADGRLDEVAAVDAIRTLERDSTLYLSKPLVDRAIARIREDESGETE